MKKTDYLKTFALVSVVLFFTLQKGNGPLLGVFLPFFLVTVLYNFIQMFRKPEERKRRGVRLAIWFVTLVLAGTVQAYWSKTSHNEAESAVKKVMAYKGRVGTYPASLNEVGLDDKYLEDKWELRYFMREGKPALVYPMQFMPLGTYEYDFETRKWQENVY